MEYLRTLDQTKAARAAGAGESSAASMGVYFMKKPHIKEYLKGVFDRQMQAAVIDAKRVLREIERLALADVGKAFNDEGGLLPLTEMDEEIRRCISGIDVEEIWEGKEGSREQVGVVKKVRFWDKTRSLEMLAKYLRLWVENSSSSGQGGPVADLSKLSDAELRALAALKGKAPK